MLTTKLKNSLYLYTQSTNESISLSEKVASIFEEKFSNLDKYDQMDLSLVIELDGWEEAFNRIDTY